MNIGLALREIDYRLDHAIGEAEWLSRTHHAQALRIPRPDPMERDEERYNKERGTGVRRSWSGD